MERSSPSSIRRPRGIAAVVAGLVGASLPFFGWLAFHGAIAAFVQDCFVTPARYFTREAGVLPPSLSDSGMDVEGLVPLLYFVAIGVVLFSLARIVRDGLRKAIDPSFLYLTLAAGCLLLVTRERFSLHNLLSVSPPVFVLLVEPICRGWTSGSRPRGHAVLAVGGTLLFCVFGVRFTLYRWAFATDPFYERRLAFARQVFRDHPTARIVVLPCAPLYYFEAGRSNPTRFDLVIPANLSPSDKLEFTRDLSARVDYVLFDELWRFDRTAFADYNREIY